MEKYNPIELWRGKRSPCEAAWCLGVTPPTYLTLEVAPHKMRLTTDDVFEIQRITNIPLEVLIDYLETPALA